MRWLDPLHRCTSLQVLLDLRCVFAVETLRLLVELGVSLVDVVDVRVVIVGPASAVLGPLLDPTIANKDMWGMIFLWNISVNGEWRREIRSRGACIQKKMLLIFQLLVLIGRVFKALLCVIPWQPNPSLMPHSCISNTSPLTVSNIETAQGKPRVTEGENPLLWQRRKLNSNGKSNVSKSNSEGFVPGL